MKGQQKTIGLTIPEKRILDQAKAFYEEMFGHRVSWGLFLVTLALGVLSVRDIEGFAISCPHCEHVIQATFVAGPGDNEKKDTDQVTA